MSKDNLESIRQSKSLEAFYDFFDEKTQASIDVIVKCICGHTLDTIINHPENISEDLT